jgi:hypothetical protein
MEIGEYDPLYFPCTTGIHDGKDCLGLGLEELKEDGIVSLRI